jgi:chromosome segregation ATPase
MEEFRASNIDVLARDKSQLVAMNGRLAKELNDTKALIAGLQKEKNEWQVAINEWDVALQNESAKTQSLTVQISECQHQISALTFKLGREASDHQASKLQIATSHLSYHDQVGYPQHPPAYQSEAHYYQQPYQQLAQQET